MNQTIEDVCEEMRYTVKQLRVAKTYLLDRIDKICAIHDEEIHKRRFTQQDIDKAEETGRQKGLAEALAGRNTRNRDIEVEVKTKVTLNTISGKAVALICPICHNQIGTAVIKKGETAKARFTYCTHCGQKIATRSVKWDGL